MDRRIITYVLTILLCASTAWARMGVLVLGGGGGASSQSCASTPYSSMTSSTTSGFNLNSTTALIYIGQEISSGASSRTLCRADFWARGITGNVSDKTYSAEVWATSSGNRSSVKATSTNTVSGSSITALSWVTFEFSGVTLAATDAVVLKEAGSVDPSNYVQFGYVTSDSDSAYSNSAIYNSSGIRTQYTSRDMGYRFYEME